MKPVTNSRSADTKALLRAVQCALYIRISKVFVLLLFSKKVHYGRVLPTTHDDFLRRDRSEGAIFFRLFHPLFPDPVPSLLAQTRADFPTPKQDPKGARGGGEQERGERESFLQGVGRRLHDDKGWLRRVASRPLALSS